MPEQIERRRNHRDTISISKKTLQWVTGVVLSLLLGVVGFAWDTSAKFATLQADVATLKEDVKAIKSVVYVPAVRGENR